MKKNTLYMLMFLSMTAKSQGKESFYVFDENWKPTKIKLAHFLLHSHQIDDTCWQWDYYNFVGPLIKTEQYRDKDGNELDGILHHYDASGYLDSATTFRKGKKNGDSWKLSGDSLQHKVKYEYREDSLIQVIDLDKVKKDSAISYGDEKESEYPGGIKAWSQYLKKKLEYPERAQKGVIQGQVIVDFIVDKKGIVMNSYISKSVEYSLDEEALKIIAGSGKWDPAFQNGSNVKSYKRQPLNFKLQ
jgi:periplasmic protein TonB